MNEPLPNRQRAYESRPASTVPNHPVAGVGASAGGKDAAAAGLEAITAGIKRLTHAELPSFETRLRLVAGFSDEARAILDADFCRAASLPGRTPRSIERLAALGRDTFGAILDAYQNCATLGECTSVSGSAQRECDLRLIGVAAERVKWERLAHGPAHPQLWHWANAALRRSGPVLGEGVCASADPRENASKAAVEREYVRLVAIFSAGYDQLHAETVAVVDRLLAYLLPMLKLHAKPLEGAVCALDVRMGKAPSRRSSAHPVSDETRFLSTDAARNSLCSLSAQLASGVVPSEIAHLSGFGESLVDGIGHLLRQWAITVPTRQHHRHSLEGDIVAVRGVDDVNALLSGRTSPNTEAVWRFRDVSRGGVGAFAPTALVAPPGIGELIALRPGEGGVWHLGVVRQVWQETGDVVRLGVQTLSLAPYLARVDDGRSPADVLVCDKLARGEAIRMVVTAGQLSFGAPLYVSSNGVLHKLKALEMQPLGDGAEVWIYQVM